jgi:hypothetical protein
MQSDVSHDFDFEFGNWIVHHCRLKHRLIGSTEWENFKGTCNAQPLLGGNGNVEDNEVHTPSGSYKAVALRAFDTTTKTWAIWWLDGRHPHHLDVPVVGCFVGGDGAFYAEDNLDGRPIRVRFLWLKTNTPRPRWEQAFSVDGGATWETNWTMDFEAA